MFVKLITKRGAGVGGLGLRTIRIPNPLCKYDNLMLLKPHFDLPLIYRSNCKKEILTGM
jgi:hypothetical protein